MPERHSQHPHQLPPVTSSSIPAPVPPASLPVQPAQPHQHIIPASVPSKIGSSTDPHRAPSPPSDWEEPEWCAFADKINFTTYPTRAEAETDISTLQSLLPPEEVLELKVHCLRGKIFLLFSSGQHPGVF